MSLHQLFCTNEAIAREEGSPFLLGIDAQDRSHVKALRLEVGEHIAVVDASSDYFEVEITAFQGEEIWVRIAKHLDAPKDTVPVMLVQGLAKGDKMDTVLRAATELGIAGFYPTEMSRSVVKLDVKKKDKRGSRFTQIARSAALQSGRTTIPEIGRIRALAQVVEQFGPRDLVIVFWEEADLANSVSAFFDMPTTRSLLRTLEHIWIVIGPEGGMSAEEVKCIEGSQAAVVVRSLGPTILRTETAGVVACALVLNELRNYATQVS